MTSETQVRPVPIINNLVLFARLIADLSVAKDGDQLFQWVATNNGKAADYENLLGALRAFGAYRRAGEAILMHEQVLDRRNPVWLQSATERLYAGAIDGTNMHISCYCYSNPDVLEEVEKFAVDCWSYGPDEAKRIAATLKIVNEEIWKRRKRHNWAEKRDKIIVRIIGFSVIIVVLLLVGMCTNPSDHYCDYSSHGTTCELV